MKHRGSRDKNHTEIAAVFDALGCSVTDTALPDIEGLGSFGA